MQGIKFYEGFFNLTSKSKMDSTMPRKKILEHDLSFEYIH